jgi:hypothetical protein
MADPTARAWLLEARNNRPAYAYAAARKTLARTSGRQLTRDDFLAVLESEIRAEYEARGEGKKAGNIISKIPRSPALAAGLAARPRPGVAPTKAPTAGAAAGLDLVGRAGAVLAPAAAARAGAGAVLLGVIEAAGLTGAALRLLAALGHRDADALTNLAFWATRPNLFGLRLVPSQPGFAGLAAEWLRLRQGVVAEALRASAPAAAPAASHTVPPQAPPATAQLPAPIPGQAPARSPAGGADAAFVANALLSTVDLLPEAQRARFRAVPWGWADYPGTTYPVAGMTPEVRARFERDTSLTYSEKRHAFVGRHQDDARALFRALAANRPGGGERRVNRGPHALITEKQFKESTDQAGIDSYIVGQTTPLPGGGRLNKHAAEAFLRMRTAALADGVALRILSGFRSRAAEEATARTSTNRVAFAGFSPHSLGLAMDVALRVGTSAKARFSEISTRMDKLVDMLQSPAYKWIYLHGAAHGFFQYEAEPWHWEYNPPGFEKVFWAERLPSQGP